jgi:uncharacterized membrane protein
MSEMNPYQPPTPIAHETTAVPAADAADDFIAAGRALDAGRGWNWITSAFSLFMKQPGLWVLLFIIYFACSVVLGLIPLLGGIANMLLYPVFGAGFMTVCRTLDNGGNAEVAMLFTGFKEKTSDLMVLGLLVLVGIVIMVVPAVLIAGGAGVVAALKGGTTAVMALGMSVVLVLLVMLAVSIPLYMALWFAAPLVLFHGLKPGAALKASFFGCLKNLMPFLLYSIVALVLCVVAVIPFGLGYLVLVPVLIASVYTAYREIYFTG